MPLAGVGADAQPAEPRRRATASSVAAGRPFAVALFFSHTTLSRLATEKT